MQSSTANRCQSRKPNAGPARSVRKPVPFLCLLRDATEVFVAGDFNGWHPASHPMKRQLDGAWRLDIWLPHGHHRYLFLVDGRPTLDPRAHGIDRNDQGERVSLIAVS